MKLKIACLMLMAAVVCATSVYEREMETLRFRQLELMKIMDETRLNTNDHNAVPTLDHDSDVPAVDRPVETEEKESRSKRDSDTNKDDDCDLERAKREDKSDDNDDNDKKDAVNSDNKDENGIILNKFIRRGMIRKRTTVKPNVGHQKTMKTKTKP